MQICVRFQIDKYSVLTLRLKSEKNWSKKKKIKADKSFYLNQFFLFYKITRSLFAGKKKKIHCTALLLFHLCGLSLISLFLPASLYPSCLQLFSCQYHVWKVSPQVGLGLVNLSVAEQLKGGYLLRRVRSICTHMGPFSHCGPTVVVSGTSSLERWPAWEHAKSRGVQLSPWHKYLMKTSCLTRWELLQFHKYIQTHFNYQHTHKSLMSVFVYL